MQTVSTRRDALTLALMGAGVVLGIVLYNSMPTMVSVMDRLMVSLWAGMAVFFLSLLVESWSGRRTAAYSRLALTLAMAAMAGSNYLRAADPATHQRWSSMLLAAQVVLIALVLWSQRRERTATRSVEA